MSNDLKLTEQQQDMVSDNHNLIYSYAHNNNLNIDDYYGLLALGLCKAARSFDETRGTSFSTFVYRCMRNELNMYWRSLNAKSSIPQENVLYYNSSINTQDKCENDFSEILLNYDEQDSIYYDIMLYEFGKMLTDKEKNIVDMLIHGMTHEEIAKEFSCSRQNIDYYVRIIKNKLFSYINN